MKTYRVELTHSLTFISSGGRLEGPLVPPSNTLISLTLEEGLIFADSDSVQHKESPAHQSEVDPAFTVFRFNELCSLSFEGRPADLRNPI